jgi:hypothetical protein
MVAAREFLFKREGKRVLFKREGKRAQADVSRINELGSCRSVRDRVEA